MGESLSKLHQVEREILVADLADELVIHVDGGHIKNKLTRIKWYLWRGNAERALYRLDELIPLCSDKSAE